MLQLLNAIEPPALLAPRSRLALGLLGLIEVADFKGVEGLHSAGKGMTPLTYQVLPRWDSHDRVFVF